MLYCKFDLENLSEIQHAVNNILPPDFLFSKVKLDYINSDREYSTKQILNLLPIRDLLIKFGLSSTDIAICGFTVISAGMALPIHLDRGDYKYSLNIPLSSVGISNTAVNFYHSTQIPKYISNGYNEYFGVDPVTCSIIGKLVTDKPCLINTNVLHSVHNYGTELRVMLLIRINKSKPISNVDLSHLTIIEKMLL